MKKILLSFVGAQDPTNKDGKEGPIVTFWKEKGDEISKVELFCTSDYVDKAKETAKIIGKSDDDINVLETKDPTDYAALLMGIRGTVEPIKAGSPNQQFIISVASGSPQIHACWFLLASSGEIPNAEIWHIRDSKHEGPPIVRVDPRAGHFPLVVERISPTRIEELSDADIKKAATELYLFGTSRVFLDCINEAARVARTNATVLLNGESGTGKELFARFIHRLHHSEQSFVAVNCGAIPLDIIESELFGHVKGAFTGAHVARPGKFEEASNGTLFLDEIAELALQTQAKLLRVLENGEIQRVGSEEQLKVNVRIISATNRNLKQDVKDGKFREDLFYRLNVVPIVLPPLRDRIADLPAIALHLLRQFEKENQLVRKELSSEAIQRLQQYPWPGNIRELKNVIARTVIHTQGQVVTAENIQFDPGENEVSMYIPTPHSGFSWPTWRNKIRDRLFQQAYTMSGESPTEAGKLLGVSPQAIDNWCKNSGEDDPAST